MKMLPFLGIVLLATFAQDVNSQTPVPTPFWKNVKPIEEKKEEKPVMEIRPAPMACGNSKAFKKFIGDKNFEFSSFNGVSEMMQGIYVLFFHNEKTNEFAIVRTDGKGLYCILEMGKQNLGKTIGPVKNES